MKIKILLLIFISIIPFFIFSQTAGKVAYVDSLRNNLIKSKIVFDSCKFYMVKLKNNNEHGFAELLLTKANLFIDSSYKLIPSIDSLNKIKICKDSTFDASKYYTEEERKDFLYEFSISDIVTLNAIFIDDISRLKSLINKDYSQIKSQKKGGFDQWNINERYYYSCADELTYLNSMPTDFNFYIKGLEVISARLKRCK